MYLLPIRPREEHVAPATTPPRVSQLPSRHEGAEPG